MDSPTPGHGGVPLTRFQQTLAPGHGAASPTPQAATGAAAAVVPVLPLRLTLGDTTLVATEILGRGGMGLTLLAHVEGEPAKHLVVKLPLADDAATLKRFGKEIELLGSLKHPHIVRMLPGGSADVAFAGEAVPRRLPWFAM